MTILGIGVDALPEAALIAWVDHQLQLPTVGIGHIATYNPEYAIAARRDPDFRDALRHADLVTADGVGITLAVRLHRNAPRLERLTGVRLLELLAESAAPIFLLGAAPEVAPAAASRLTALHPTARFAGWWWDGSPDPRHDQTTLDRVAASGARAVAVAYGAPGQILWIERNRAALDTIGVGVVVGVGGALDYWAGIARQPPSLIRKLGLEWLYRLMREPWRWRRQLVLPLFALLALAEALGTWLPSKRNSVRD